MRDFFLWLLPKIARWHPKNKSENRQGYPQLWYCMPRRWVIDKYSEYKRAKPRLLLEWLCGILTGHELSETEWGYGGGGLVDRNCRWCDKCFSIPIEEEPTKGYYLEELLNQAPNP